VCEAYKNRVDLRIHSSRKHNVSLPVKKRRTDVVAVAAAAADIGPDNADADSVRQPDSLLT